MDPNVSQWLHLAFRWMHIIAAVMWIGSSIFFNWLDSHLEESSKKSEGVEGELWMVHSGGFYQVEKKLVAPSELPKTLHWFKWEAGFTWVSGVCLLVVVYYLDGGLLMVDETVSTITPKLAILIGVGTILVSWAIYDAVWNSALGKAQTPAIVITVLMIVGVAFGLSQLLSGRATYMHVGAMMGTWMVANVWMRIIPAQRALVAAVRKGKMPDPEPARRAKQRSRHNNYMTYPVILTMISNHFPNLYPGKAWTALVLVAIFVVGASIRHYQNTRGGTPKMVFAAIAAAVAISAGLSMRGAPKGTRSTKGASADATAKSAGGPAAAPISVDPALVGAIHGVVRFGGTPPAPKELTLPASCPHDGPVYDGAVLVADGKLQNAFVWISEGLSGWSEPPPQAEVVIDQQGCTYAPRVLGAQVGQPITFVNSDPVMHNVHSYADHNDSFNAPMPNKQQRLTRTFANAEVMVHMKCDVNPWMRSFIGVVPHPYYAVTGSNGEFTFDHVPPGAYTIEAWHEVYGRQTQKVTLGAKGAIAADFTFK